MVRHGRTLHNQRGQARRLTTTAFAARKYVTLKNNAIEKQPGFVDAAKMDFRLRAGAEVLEKLPELSTIPLEKIGVKTR